MKKMFIIFACIIAVITVAMYAINSEKEISTIRGDTFEFNFVTDTHPNWQMIFVKVDQEYWLSKPMNQNGTRYDLKEEGGGIQSIIFRLEGHGNSVEVSFASDSGNAEVIIDSFKEILP